MQAPRRPQAITPLSIASLRIPGTCLPRNALHQGVAININLKLANLVAIVEGKESRAGQAHPARITSFPTQILAVARGCRLVIRPTIFERRLTPFCNAEAMQLHLDEIAIRVTAGAHAILILDQAGWHGAKDLKIPSNLSLLPLPPRAPELNPQENIWQVMRQNWLSNRIFKSSDDIVDHCCYAWNTLIDQPWKIMSIAYRDWAVVGQSI